MNAKENYEKFKSILGDLESDFQNFDSKGTKVAAKRSRHHLLRLKKLCVIIRRQIMEEINGKPSKYSVQPEDIYPMSLGSSTLPNALPTTDEVLNYQQRPRISIVNETLQTPPTQPNTPT